MNQNLTEQRHAFLPQYEWKDLNGRHLRGLGQALLPTQEKGFKSLLYECSKVLTYKGFVNGEEQIEIFGTDFEHNPVPFSIKVCIQNRNKTSYIYNLLFSCSEPRGRPSASPVQSWACPVVASQGHELRAVGWVGPSSTLTVFSRVSVWDWVSLIKLKECTVQKSDRGSCLISWLRHSLGDEDSRAILIIDIML